MLFTVCLLKNTSLQITSLYVSFCKARRSIVTDSNRDSLALSLAADVLGALLRSGQPLQEPAHLHRVYRGHVPRQEAARDAAPHLRHIGGGLSQHAARYSLPFPPLSLRVTSDPGIPTPHTCYLLSAQPARNVLP